jgi:hypothetical protein
MSLHIVLDDPERNGPSPKGLERLRRDKKRKCSCLNDVEVDTTVPNQTLEGISVQYAQAIALKFSLCVHKYSIESRLISDNILSPEEG